ncbi:PTS sugar transporter subunit IIB [Sporolactobacillus sp. STSJ-5]|uniref:PTS sugar transporter subunit IIB n=1 Tax=Sporolactobacillus sp. STSJ-5 TaxID=2965076 RepID=UPI0021035BD3|nr:PTS sugar transporter subunit IIB [Sporolactobacillus sp. STSJ-5]MCQ2011165.1 PTS sugar transporter subunit IIB [Sporolactobacillus sp. STSJ-5]
MDVRLLRIDSRLLHGQVSTNWAKAIPCISLNMKVGEKVSAQQIDPACRVYDDLIFD